jgi:uncharacterized protein involved in type VI secretion and phage assembly
LWAPRGRDGVDQEEENQVSTFRRLSELAEREWRNKIYGVVVAVVTNNKDPDGKYRVKVRFPWLPNGDQSGQNSEESDWYRVVTTMAGNGRGMFMLPEVGDEVLVAFEHGDISRGYIVGSLWNANDSPTMDNKGGKNNVRGWKSRSGHILEFCDDKDNGEKITIKSNGGAYILIDDKNKKIDIYDQSGNNFFQIDGKNDTINMKSNDKVNFEAKGDFSLKCDNLKIEAKTDIKMQAKQNFETKATSNFTLKASGQGTVQSSGTLTIKGSQVNIN